MSIPTRERCQMCHHVSPVGFSVPDHVWQQVVHPHWQNSILCLPCFISRADEKLVRWDWDIKLYPVSMRSHLEFVRGAVLPDEQEDDEMTECPPPQERAFPLLGLDRFREAVPLTDCGGWPFMKDEREDIARYMQQGAEMQRDVDYFDRRQEARKEPPTCVYTGMPITECGNYEEVHAQPFTYDATLHHVLMRCAECGHEEYVTRDVLIEAERSHA